MSERLPKEVWIERRRGVPDQVWVDTTRIRGKNKTSELKRYIRSDEHILRLGTQLGPIEDRIKKLESRIADYERVLEHATQSHDLHIADLALATLGRLV